MSEPILAPSWGPTWLHFGPQDASKTAILGIQYALFLTSYFRCLFGSIFGPSWGPSWPQLGGPKQPRSAPEGPRKASWRHLGSRNRPRPAQTPSGPPSGVDFGTLGGRFRGLFDVFSTGLGGFLALFVFFMMPPRRPFLPPPNMPSLLVLRY